MKGHHGWLRVVVVVTVMLLVVSGCTWFGRVNPKPNGTAGNPLNSGGLRGNQALGLVLFYDDQQEKPRGTILDLVAKNRDLVTDLAPFWYSVANDGSIQDKSEADVKAWARKEKIKLMPLITNANGGDVMLNDPGARKRAIDALVTILKKENYDGYSLDFQLLSPKTRGGVTAFTKELWDRIHPLGKRLTVDVIPEGQAQQASQPYDYKALANASDAIILMTYDQHGEGSKPGPVAELGWVEQRIQAAVAQVPASKVMLGIASYGYDWPGGSQKATTIATKEAGTLSQGKVKRGPDGSPYFTYTKNGTTHTVWYEDAQSVARKIDLARKYKLLGIAMWRAGYEDAPYWATIRSKIGR